MHVVGDLDVADDAGSAADRAMARRCARGPRCPPARPSRCVHRCARCAPTWIRLSSLTPSSITVSSSAPRSMQVLAPISTSSPMRTAPSCSIFSQRPSHGREAEAVGADHHAGVHDAALADRAAFAERHTLGQPGVRADTGMGTDVALRTDHRMRPDLRAARPRRPARRRARWGRPCAVASTTALGCTPGSGAGCAAPPPLREPRVVQVRIVGHDGRAARAAQPRRSAGATITQPAPVRASLSAWRAMRQKR